MKSMTKRTLSGRGTFFVKFIFPTLWIAMFGLGALWTFRDQAMDAEPGLWGLPERWSFFVLWVFGTVFLAWACFPLKRVRVDGDTLYISNYVREIHVPLADVTGVKENYFISNRPISVAFRTPTMFGQKIVFIPRGSIVWFWRRHPVAEELRMLVLQAGGSPTVPTAG
jgi:hypothetical protein